MICDTCSWKTNTENNGEGCECDFDEEKCMKHNRLEAFDDGYRDGLKDEREDIVNELKRLKTKLKAELNNSLPLYASDWRKEMNNIIDNIN
jgi:hypothetical protein